MPHINHTALSLSHLILESGRGNQRLQKILYDMYAEKMNAVCLRYAKNAADAEDILQQGFIKVFRNIDKYRGDGSFEGWIRKIITRTAITHITKKRKLSFQTAIEYSHKDNTYNILDKLAEKDIVGMITKLPPGYRKIFTLYVIEGYNHREIAEMLGCSEGNCKSQFYRSRTRLQQMLQKTA